MHPQLARLKSILHDHAHSLQRLREYQKDSNNACIPNRHGIVFRLADVFSRTWHLGITAFGGPAVHFRIFHRNFVDGHGGYAPWFDEKTYQDIFAVSQTLPGPASTKMIFIMAFLRAGVLAALMTFLLWTLPGAIAMFGLSVGVSHLQDHFPEPAYALLSGLNAASVGIIALAAVGLAQNAIQDRVTRILVIAGACAGLCYSALWYFPALITAGGITTFLWDRYVSRWVGKIRAARERRQRQAVNDGGEPAPGASIALEESLQNPTGSQPLEAPPFGGIHVRRSLHQEEPAKPRPVDAVILSPRDAEKGFHGISPKTGIALILIFIATLAAVLAARFLLTTKLFAFRFFSNMYLAGTIIFGGGPVVIPLLREYVVDPGWVSSRDFLIGLAVIQALPGPNFNFVVYLGALAFRNKNQLPILGALVGYVGMFFPALVLAIGVQSFWDRLRSRAAVGSVLRGVNAIAVGLVFTAVYRLWEIGYVTAEKSRGQSLADEPWWVVVCAVSYSGTAWFGVPAPVSILGGGVLGLCWYGVVA